MDHDDDQDDLPIAGAGVAVEAAAAALALTKIRPLAQRPQHQNRPLLQQQQQQGTDGDADAAARRQKLLDQRLAARRAQEEIEVALAALDKPANQEQQQPARTAAAATGSSTFARPMTVDDYTAQEAVSTALAGASVGSRAQHLLATQYGLDLTLGTLNVPERVRRMVGHWDVFMQAVKLRMFSREFDGEIEAAKALTPGEPDVWLDVLTGADDGQNVQFTPGAPQRARLWSAIVAAYVVHDLTPRGAGQLPAAHTFEATLGVLREAMRGADAAIIDGINAFAALVHSGRYRGSLHSGQRGGQHHAQVRREREDGGQSDGNGKNNYNSSNGTSHSGKRHRKGKGGKNHRGGGGGNGGGGGRGNGGGAPTTASAA